MLSMLKHASVSSLRSPCRLLVSTDPFRHISCLVVVACVGGTSHAFRREVDVELGGAVCSGVSSEKLAPLAFPHITGLFAPLIQTLASSPPCRLPV